MIDLAYFLGIFLIFLRISSYFVATKIFFPSGTPIMFKTGFSMILSYGIISGVDHNTVLAIDSNYMIAFYIISEVLTGLILGYITNLVFQAAKLAGSWIDIHAGFSMVTILDPATQTSTTLMGNLFYFVSLVFFFMINGQELIVKSIYESISIVPLGHTIVYQETVMGAAETIVDFFVLGVKIALPIVLIIVMTDICLGLITRTVPTIPIMIFGMPIKNILGFITFLIIMPTMLKIIGTAIYELPDIFNKVFKLIPVIPLAFVFASDDKTEEATPKKKSDSRKKGQIARSKDVGVALTMVVCTIAISACWNMMINGFKEVMIYFLQLPMLDNFDNLSLTGILITVIMRVAYGLLPIALPIMVGGIIASLMQTGFLITGEPLKPSFGKLNPLSGMKNMISKRSLVDLCKNLIVISIVSIIAYKYISSNYQQIISMSNIYLPSLNVEIKNLVLDIFKQICIVLIVIAAIDYFVQFKMHNQDLKMSKQEVKDEYKQQEGDPQLKGKIKQKQREMSRQRMMQSVSDATVVITNPTHLAIALKYEEGTDMEAPKVLAKGADYLALKIKSIAKENEIPIIENKPLARMMYDKVEIDSDIPPELYQGVAEILAIVMKIKK
ncbi:MULTISPECIES: fused FliR family export protein/FlhB family type III secretion system protein [Clostridium]|uniref:fused FliR family export protein/FlhB family type III secretion system protein n=1 Tax=Clostridium TaxID=1485 RepID=UPI00129B20F1|nr:MULTISPECIES: fused FliR family export protein/FlhB family type III secretion system protein [Clostridium]MDU1068751.1 fused FliR family export protein/FlhB family type III secretion system protein [Clostridium sp.]MDU2676335.1 fused FliR family export protein/FlhB family type III secretion system protein [Clostridium sp.]MDU4210628.1 fused FliR family export protein/FlhB family type III secretion system protein [Clostridium sp.]MDU5176413.1 fused FliR family export protein/FlhB family type 